jgi:drug/metabolite transporter (DMT)-like permease
VTQPVSSLNETMSHPSPNEHRGVFLMLASVVLFAVNVLLIRGLSLHVPGIDGWMATLFRSIAGCAVVLICFGPGGQLSLRRVFTNPLLVLRGILGAAGIILFYITVVHLGAGRAVVLNLTYPMFAALIAAIWLREPLRPTTFIWIAVGFLGLCLFLSGGDSSASTLFYDLLGIAGAVTAAVVVVIIRRLHTTEHSSSIYAAQCLFGLFVALPVSAPEVPVLGPGTWVILLAAGAVVAVGQLTMTFSYRHLTVSKGASLQMLLPLATALGGFLLFEERFSPLELAAAALTIAATVQILRAPKAGPTPVSAPSRSSTKSPRSKPAISSK